MRVGLIGEDPTDTVAIQNLLAQKYNYNFTAVLKHLRGSQLDSAKTDRLLAAELKSKQLDVLVFIRDLDDLETNKEKVRKLQSWFYKLSLNFKGKSLFLLNIYEIEALILADIESFNKIYETKIAFKGNPMMQREPKEFLISKTAKSKKKFKESDNKDLFRHLRFDSVFNKCRYFKDFISAFENA